jgi:hypothetical protein
MVFNGRTTGPAYTTTLLPNDTLIKLTNIAQTRLGIKLVRPQILRRVGINGLRIVESEETYARFRTTYDHTWSQIIQHLGNGAVDEMPIMTVTEQRQWNKTEKEKKIITSLINIEDDVFHYERDLFARWYDLNHFNVSEVFRSGLSLLPHFREVRIYYNCQLNREEYIKAGYITGLIYNSPHSSSSPSPLFIGMSYVV